MRHKKAAFGLALLVLLLSAVLGATVLRDPIASAATPFQNVIVSNTTDQPVPVAGTVKIDGTSTVQVQSDLEPYEHTTFFNQDTSGCTQFVCNVSFPAVPAGKRLVITYASARNALTTGGSAPSVSLGVNGNGVSDPQILLPAPQRIGFDSYVASGPVNFYAKAGDVPTLSLGGQFVNPPNTATASVVGYLVDAS